MAQFLKEKASTLSNILFDGSFGSDMPAAAAKLKNQLPDGTDKKSVILHVDASLSVSGVNDEEILQAIKRHPRAVAEQVSKVLT